MAASERTLREVLLTTRWSIGLTQEELAAQSGLSVRTISDIERGRVLCPRPTTLRRLAETLGMTRGEKREFLLLAMRGAAGGSYQASGGPRSGGTWRAKAPAA
jgi:transcriptional regulator with XRE-family HTH domain